MLLRIVLASLHLLGLGIGLGAIWTRARALRGPLDPVNLQRIFAADSFWGAAAGLWIISGLVRAFGGYEKGSAYYLHNGLFGLKMVLLVLILALEVRPMIGLIRWRIRLKRNQTPDFSAARSFSLISHVQAALVITMVGVACALARGWG